MLLTWVLGLGSSLLTHVTGLDSWPTHLAQGVVPGSLLGFLSQVVYLC